MLLKNGWLWKQGAFHRKDVRIEQGRISRIEVNISENPGEKVIDITDKYILPGIIDCHWHLGMAYDDPNTGVYYHATPMQGAYICASYALRMLKAGFTTVRECGTMFGETVELRNAIKKGLMQGPRLLVCGSAISIPGGHMPSAVHVSGPEEARRASRELLAQDVDFLKVMLTGGLGRTNEIPDTVEIDLDELEAICREGKRVNKQVACHAHGKTAMLNAIKAGASTIEHATMLDNEVIEGLLEKNMAIVPTFSPYGLVAERGKDYGIPQEVRDSAARLFEEKCRRFENAVRQGVNILYGRDVYLIAPEDISGEMIFMENAGMKAADIIQSATENAAEFLGIQRETGMIETGRSADLIVLNENPLEDLNYFNEQRSLVLKEGQIIV